MKRTFESGLLFLALCTILVASAAMAQTKPIELKYATFGPDVHPQSGVSIDWCKEIEKRTGGRVKIIFYGGQTLLKAPAIYDGVATGVADLGMTILAYTRGRFPLMAGLDLPLGYPRAMVGSRVANDVYWKFTPAELADTHTFYLHTYGPAVVVSKKPVRKLEDMRGLKMRGSGHAGEIARALGATPVGGAITETYDALAKGVVDGTIVPMEGLSGWKLAEVIGYITNCRSIGFSTMFWVGMNKAKWESLPKEVQQVFTDVSKEWVDKHGALWERMDAEGRDFALKMKREIIELPPEEQARWAAAVQPVIKEFTDGMAAKKLPGKELVDFAGERIKVHSGAK